MYFELYYLQHYNGLRVYNVNSLYSSWPAPEPKAVSCKLEQRYYRRYDIDT